jgi:MerR family transcriptional regulator, heat shock protein HspR
MNEQPRPLFREYQRGRAIFMNQEYYYRKQVIEIFDLDEQFLEELEAEDLICSSEMEAGRERVFLPAQVERIRIIRNLVEDLEVNLPGVEVILEMRENMVRMQRQFDKILELLVQDLKGRLRGP